MQRYSIIAYLLSVILTFGYASQSDQLGFQLECDLISLLGSVIDLTGACNGTDSTYSPDVYITGTTTVTVTTSTNIFKSLTSYTTTTNTISTSGTLVITTTVTTGTTTSTDSVAAKKKRQDASTTESRLYSGSALSVFLLSDASSRSTSVPSSFTNDLSQLYAGNAIVGTEIPSVISSLLNNGLFDIETAVDDLFGSTYTASVISTHFTMSLDSFCSCIMSDFENTIMPYSTRTFWASNNYISTHDTLQSLATETVTVTLISSVTSDIIVTSTMTNNETITIDITTSTLTTGIEATSTVNCAGNIVMDSYFYTVGSSVWSFSGNYELTTCSKFGSCVEFMITSARSGSLSQNLKQLGVGQEYFVYFSFYVEESEMSITLYLGQESWDVPGSSLSVGVWHTYEAYYTADSTSSTIEIVLSGSSGTAYISDVYVECQS